MMFFALLDRRAAHGILANRQSRLDETVNAVLLNGGAMDAQRNLALRKAQSLRTEPGSVSSTMQTGGIDADDRSPMSQAAGRARLQSVACSAR